MDESQPLLLEWFHHGAWWGKPDSKHIHPKDRAAALDHLSSTPDLYYYPPWAKGKRVRISLWPR